jgi:hydrogenase-4 component B
MDVLLLTSLGAYLISALAAPLGRSDPGPYRVSSLGCGIAALLGLPPVVSVLAGGSPVDLRWAWGLPGSFHLHLDLLSAWFSLPVLGISLLAALYGRGYRRGHRGGAGEEFFFQLLAGGMYFVLVAWDGMLFLMAWEIMSLSAFFLVLSDSGQLQTRRAGWIYLAATHLGTAFLFGMFVLLGTLGGTWDFSAFSGLGRCADWVFLLAVLGFGAKAGFFGLHVWLPEAHPAAPSHVSGLMSGVMIKTGIYGLMRVLSFAPNWPHWWGWLLLGVGILSGLGGVLFALMQHDLKRLLAYHSVENIGIICLGLGLGVLAMDRIRSVALLALAGALLHVWNHGIFKTALFFGAGSVARAAGTREMDLLGGLQRRMPFTGAAFLISAAAICGLPPLNGFVGEWLIYLASYRSAMPGGIPSALGLGGLGAIASLALIGGLAALCFAKVYGVVFLGEPRSVAADEAREVSPAMWGPTAILAGACLVLGLGGFLALRIAAPLAAGFHPTSLGTGDPGPLRQASLWLRDGTVLMLALLGTAALLAWGRDRLLRGRTVTRGTTWSCGYSAPTPRMQYTASSFVQPLGFTFRSLLRTRSPAGLLPDPLPQGTRFSTRTPGLVMERFYLPLFLQVAAISGWMRRIQRGETHVYVLYLVLALLAALLWGAVR